ncbi:MAG TPA: HNH endonuclease [Thermoanaerobaculia bacterium]|nr:HNH endonuclease [Thermoanaerobaculia bacterium]
MPKKPRAPHQPGSKAKILYFLLANIGRVVTSDEIREASGNKSEWARRLRELRNEEGYQILSHNDRADLKPGEYLLETDKRLPAFARKISKETRAAVLARNGNTCQLCGVSAGDTDPYDPSRTIRLTMGHIIDSSKGGTDQASNLRALCSNCNEGLQNISPPKPSLIDLLTFIRRATRDDQRAALEWLRKKFKD